MSVWNDADLWERSDGIVGRTECNTLDFAETFTDASGHLHQRALIVVGLLRSRTGWSKTDSIIRKLVLLTFECQVRRHACHSIP